MLLRMCLIITVSCRSSIEELLDIYHKQIEIALKNEVRSLQIIAEPKVAWECLLIRQLEEKKLQVFLEKLKSEQDAKCEFGIIGF